MLIKTLVNSFFISNTYVIYKAGFDYVWILNYLEMDVLYFLNIRKLSLVVSTTNYPEINRYISELGYRVISNSVIMRKIID